MSKTSCVVCAQRSRALAQHCLTATHICCYDWHMQVQHHVWRFRMHTLGLVCAVLAVHTGMFILMYTLLQAQAVLVNNLGIIGETDTAQATCSSVTFCCLRIKASKTYHLLPHRRCGHQGHCAGHLLPHPEHPLRQHDSPGAQASQ
jgi:hypothetical protein